MKQKIIAFIPFFSLIIVLSGCGTTVGNDLSGAYNMTQCKYAYNSISNISVSGINLTSGTALSPMNLVKLTTILSGNPSNIPLNFTVNMNVTNPNTTPALLNKLQYEVSIDDIHFTNGMLEQAVNIPGGGTQTIPLTIGVDVAGLMKDNSQSALLNIVKNIAGISGEKSTVSLSLRPTFNIAGQPITSPIAFPVNFSFGGK
jgi:Conserved secreted protein